MAYGLTELQQEFALSPEITGKLQIYADMLNRWQPRINLVSRKSLADFWHRHFRDSAQLAAFMEDIKDVSDIWLDVGSGAGFPGLVLAMMRSDRHDIPVQLIESDQRKAIFLREVIRATNAPALVHNQRVERFEQQDFAGAARLITARALAPLQEILDLTEKLGGANTKYLLLKGQDVDRELTLASKYRKMRFTKHPSRTDPEGVVLEITEVSRV